jgi:hypothetical protein
MKPFEIDVHSTIVNMQMNRFLFSPIMLCAASSHTAWSITGHRSSASLAIYQKVASDEKLRMGCTLGYALTGDSSCLIKQDEISSVYQQHPPETNYQPSSHTPNPSLQEIDVISRSERCMSLSKRQNPCQENTIQTKRRPNRSSATIVVPRQALASSDPIFFEDDMDD